MEKWLPKPLQSVIAQYSFYLGLLIELTIVVAEKSEYILQYEGLWFRLTFLLFGISLVTTEHSRREWIGLLLFGLLGGISYLMSERNEILRFVVFIWACHGREMKRVLKLTFWYTAAGSLVLVLLSVLGIFGKMVMTTHYRQDFVETRYCFGMGHPNAFHCMVLALTLLGIYCYHKKIRWYGYGAIMALHVLVFFLTKSRTGLMVSVGSLVVIVLLAYLPVLQRWVGGYLVGILLLAGAVALSVFMAKHSIFHPKLKELDVILSGRILQLHYGSVNHEGMLSTWSLWSRPQNTYFFDLGFVRVFYWYGIIPAAVYFLGQCRLLWCSFKKRDYMLLAVMIAITVYTVFEAHFVSEYLGRNYILFFMGMYLGDMLGEKPPSEGQTSRQEAM